MESIEQTINGSVGPSSRVTSTISRNGDLVYRLFYEVVGDAAAGVALTGGTVTSGTGGTANIGSAIFDNVEIEIGGQRIDRQTGQWMNVWASLCEENSARLRADQFGKGGTLFQELTQMGGTVTHASLVDHDSAGAGVIKVDCKVPLQFWFCRNPGLALPLIALQYHEVKVVTAFSSLMVAGSGTKLWADYIYLDTDERRRFAQVSHEYLIEQVQYQAGSSQSVSTELNFNHPVKELIWTGPSSAGVITKLATTDDYQLKLNGHDRMSARPLSYFAKQQVWMHHTGPGDITTGLGNAAAAAGSVGGAGSVGNSGTGIAVYSFALKPEEHQPSGTCNFSRIDNAQLIGPSQSRDVFAVNYNVLRIMSGMGGLAYSN
jgi:hypothetical protein